MNKNGAIVVVEDDMEDQEMFSEVFNELNYKNEMVRPETSLQTSV
jgi:hypothetical protein